MAKAGKRAEVIAPELGTIGLKQTGGVVREEFLRELQGQRGMKVYREMRDNSAVNGASLTAIEMLARQVPWELVPPMEATDEEKKRTERIAASFHDMSSPWTENIAEFLSMLAFGFSVHEIVFKECHGEDDNPNKSSRFDDGMISWAKLPIRPQETICKWEIGPHGEVTGVYQRPPLSFTGEIYIPASKYLHFTAKSAAGNPEGRSILRNAYFSWYFAKRIQELEGVGIERHLAGLPVMKIPGECMASGASAAQAAVYTAAQEIVQNIRNDSEAGVVLSSDTKDGKPLYELMLLSSNGAMPVDTNVVIERHERRMAQTLLADFILLGHEGVGSFSLSSDKTKLFGVALGGWLDAIADVFNLKAIPQLMRVNGWPADRAPKLKHGDIEAPDIARWGDFVNKMVGANIITADDNLEAEARRVLGIPPRDPSSPERERPAATNTKPFGGAPDKGKPPEENPGKAAEAPPTKADDGATLRLVEAFGVAQAAQAETTREAIAGLSAVAGVVAGRPAPERASEAEVASNAEVAMTALNMVKAAIERPMIVEVETGPLNVEVQAAQAPNVTVMAPAAPNVTVEAASPIVIPAPQVAVNTPKETRMTIVGPVETKVISVPATEEVVDVSQRDEKGGVKKARKVRKMVRE